MLFFCYIIANGYVWLATETVFPMSTEGIAVGGGVRREAKILEKKPQQNTLILSLDFGHWTSFYIWSSHINILVCTVFIKIQI